MSTSDEAEEASNRIAAAHRAGLDERSPKPDGHSCAEAMGITFDEEAAKGLDEYEVRRRWPRGDGVCPGCGCNVIAYASFMHYIAGDW